MQLTITKPHHLRHKICDFVNASYQGTPYLRIFAKHGKTNLEFDVDDVAPTNVTVYKRSENLPTEGYSKFIIIEQVEADKWRWTQISQRDSWKVGYFGKGSLTMSFGSQIPFNELPRYIREQFIKAKIFCQ